MRHPAFVVPPLIVSLCTLQTMSALAPTLSYAQTATAPAQTQTTTMPTQDQLRTLLSPIALYPDQLLSQICNAASDPQQIVNVDNWIHQQKGLTGEALSNAAQQQNFDPAFIALVNFPQVLDQMAQHVNDYAQIGYAYQANQKMVQDTIQSLRKQAQKAGNLKTNAQQKVVVESTSGQQTIVIEPANPQVVYVPQYNPTVVYAAPPPGPSTGAVVATAVISFGAGIALGAWMNNSYPWGWGGWGWSWGHPPPPRPMPPPHWGPPGPGPGPRPYGPPNGGGGRYPPNGGGGRPPNGGGAQNRYGGVQSPQRGGGNTPQGMSHSGYQQPHNNMGGAFHPGNGASTRQAQSRGTRSFGGFSGGGGRRGGGRR
ncbi:DUF3300 domain-containing protein [Terriglobus sp. RCC_193]|uniref:DUF3300 domain-containing protein n=1 Tax=Terriglobus sp. RCC_193 TaxID=3239218 RepID=UPI0035260431